MSLNWQKLAGDVSQFAMSFELHSDPDHGRGATPEESASWGGFQIWAEGCNLCAHTEEGETSHGVHWYLLPVMEWLAENWEPLLHEERLPTDHRGGDAWLLFAQSRFPPLRLDEDAADRWEMACETWWRRHFLRSCRQGGLFPDVAIRRWRHLVEVSWGVSALPGAPANLRFLAPRGVARLAPRAVAEPLYEVLHAAAAELAKRLPESDRLQALRERVAHLEEPHPEQRYHWLTGFNSTHEVPHLSWTEVAETLHDAARTTPGAEEELLGRCSEPLVMGGSSHASLMFGSVSPSIRESDAGILVQWLLELFMESRAEVPVDRYARSLPVGTSPRPAEQGYALAEEFLEDLGLEPAATIDPLSIVRQLGVEVREIELEDATVRAVSMAGKRHRPAILVNRRCEYNQTDSGYRFTLAHELCHLLCDRDPESRLALASGPWAPRDVEQRADAFAAMFLMPADLLRAQVAELGRDLRTREGLRQLVGPLGTSFTTTARHLGNLGFLSEDEVERLLEAPS